MTVEEVGIQVPAVGSIRAGETPEAAALREAGEETGLKHFKIVRSEPSAEAGAGAVPGWEGREREDDSLLPHAQRW